MAKNETNMDAIESAQPQTSVASTSQTNTEKPNIANGEKNTNNNSPKQETVKQQANGSKKVRKAKVKMQQSNQEDPSIRLFKMMQEEVRNGLMSCESGCELEVLHSTLRPDHHVLWYKCMEVKKDLWTAFSRQYPSVRLEVFGSTVMGIAFKDSDFDFYIELTREQLNIKPAQVIGKAMRILARTGNFTNFLPISHARVPILKCYHIRTGYQCDLNFSDSFGILNSPIMAHLLTFDSRIYVLATIIKYWMKVHDCAGKNRISNYGVMWLLLFYLQSIPDPILPPIVEFQNQKRVRPYFVHFFNFAFDYQLRNMTRNQRRCSELLLGFFKFYKTFDFGSQLICPLYGRVYHKADVLAKKHPEFRRYEEILQLNPNEVPMQFNKSICIQDPFDITHTIPGAIASMEYQKIIWKIGLAADIIESELNKEGETTSLFLKIFDVAKFDQFVLEQIKKEPKKSRNKDAVSASSSTSSLNTTAMKNTTLLIPTDPDLLIVRDMLSKTFNDANAKIDNHTINQYWAENVIQFVVHMLQDIFMLKIQLPAADKTAKNKVGTDKMATENKNLTIEDNAQKLLDKKSDKFLKMFEIIGSNDVFLGRKQVKNITGHTLSAEKDTSAKRLKMASCRIQLNASVKITTDLENFSNVSVELTDLIKTKKNNFFRTFCALFAQHISIYLKIYFMHKQLFCSPTDQNIAVAEKIKEEVVSTATKLPINANIRERIETN